MKSKNRALMGRQYRSYLVSATLMCIMMSMTMVVDGIIVKIFVSTEAFAAVNAAFPLTLSYGVLTTLIGLGGSMRYSVALGQGDGGAKHDIFSVAAFSLLLCGAAVTLSCWLWRGAFTAAVTAGAPEISPLFGAYCLPLLLGAPLIIGVPGIAYFIRADGAPGVGSAVMICANIVNILLDILFMGVLRMGITGAGLATVCGYVCGAVILTVFLVRRHYRFRLNNGVWGQLREICGYGLPPALERIFTFGQILLMNMIVMRYMGTRGMAVWAVAMNCMSLSSIFIGGGVQAMLPLAGMLFGSSDYANICYVLKKTLIFILSATAVIVLLLEIAPQLALGVYGVAITDGFESLTLRLYAPYLLTNGVVFVLMLYYQTIKKGVITVTMAALQAGLSAFLFWCLLVVTKGSTFSWAAFPIASALALATGLLMAAAAAVKSNRTLLLLPKTEQEEWGMTVRPDESNICTQSEAAAAMLTSYGIPAGKANRIAMALEDMQMEIKNANDGGNILIETRLKIEEGRLLLFLRDDGRPLDIVARAETETENSSNIGLIKKVVTTYEYERIMGMNCTRMTLEL